MKDILWPERQEDREEGGWKTLSYEQTEPQSDTPDGSLRRRDVTGIDASPEDGQPMRKEPDSDSSLPRIPERLIDQPFESPRKEPAHIV